MKKRLLWMCTGLIIFSMVVTYSDGSMRASVSKTGLQDTDIFSNLRQVIPRYLGKPYKKGKAGPKRFDCSGFVWRVMRDSGIRVKRSSARKLFLRLPRVAGDNKWDFGTVVFFRNLRHCGIVNDEATFYHASSTAGTTLSPFDPYWREKICGFRDIPR